MAAIRGYARCGPRSCRTSLRAVTEAGEDRDRASLGRPVGQTRKERIVMTEEQVPDLARMRAVVDELKARERLVEFNKLATWRPYPKQQNFSISAAPRPSACWSRATRSARAPRAPMKWPCILPAFIRRLGKGAASIILIRAWAGGESTVAVRDIQQRLLLGEPGVEELSGTGFIPRAMIVDRSLARGASDALDSVQIRHASGGISVLSFKSYEQGREKVAGPVRPRHLVRRGTRPPHLLGRVGASHRDEGYRVLDLHAIARSVGRGAAFLR